MKPFTLSTPYSTDERIDDKIKWEFTGSPIRKTLTDKCIVLDIDETLVHSFGAMEYNRHHLTNYPELLPYIYTLEISSAEGPIFMWGYRRPHLEEFLRFCFQYFRTVAIWSAGGYDYVHAVVDQIFKRVQRPHLIFTSEDCHYISSREYTKPLYQMINKVPELNKIMDLNNTLIIDDRIENFSYNPDNGIIIPPFSPTPTSTHFHDQHLLKLIKWFNSPEVIHSPNVTLLNKSRIFI